MQPTSVTQIKRDHPVIWQGVPLACADDIQFLFITIHQGLAAQL